MRKLTLLATLALVAGGLLVLMLEGGEEASAGHVACGDTLTSNTRLHDDLMCSGTALTIGADNITLNCRGHTLTGDGTGFGVALGGRNGVTIKNCTATGFETGFLLDFNNGNTLKRNKATENGSYGFYLIGSRRNTLKRNKATANGLDGFLIEDLSSDDNTLEKNKATGNGGDGFHLSAAPARNILLRNQARGNVGRGFFLEGVRDNYLVKNEAKENGEDGFFLERSRDNHLVKNKATKNGLDGFRLSGAGARGNTLTENTAQRNGADGFQTDADSESNTFIVNKAEKNDGFGYRDSSMDSGTAGTANAYVGNTCKRNRAGPSDPVGLCEGSGGGGDDDDDDD